MTASITSRRLTSFKVKFNYVIDENGTKHMFVQLPVSVTTWEWHGTKLIIMLLYFLLHTNCVQIKQSETRATLQTIYSQVSVLIGYMMHQSSRGRRVSGSDERWAGTKSGSPVYQTIHWLFQATGRAWKLLIGQMSCQSIGQRLAAILDDFGSVLKHRRPIWPSWGLVH